LIQLSGTSSPDGRQSSTTLVDMKYLARTPVSIATYHAITDEYNLRHGVELVANRIELHECATGLHEYIGGCFDDWVMNLYGKQNLWKLRSRSTSSWIFANVRYDVYGWPF
jgi:hypothetical protein